MTEENKSFEYTYSAEHQEEIESIRRKYMTETRSTQEEKLERLRRLDSAVTAKAMAASLGSGILGALILGTGMSLVMTDLAHALGMRDPLLPGILIGLLGMVGVIAAYPLYQHVLKKERAKAAPEILKLTEELSSQ